jgi:hypothetical protein
MIEPESVLFHNIVDLSKQNDGDKVDIYLKPTNPLELLWPRPYATLVKNGESVGVYLGKPSLFTGRVFQQIAGEVVFKENETLIYEHPPGLLGRVGDQPDLRIVPRFSNPFNL